MKFFFFSFEEKKLVMLKKYPNWCHLDVDCYGLTVDFDGRAIISKYW